MNRSGYGSAMLLALLFAPLIFTGPLGAQRVDVPAPAGPANVSRAQCNAMPSAILHRSVNFCVILPPHFDPANAEQRLPVVYYLHGLGDNERTLVISDGWDMLEHLWEQSAIGPMIIATPDARDTWYVNALDGSENYEDFFIKEFVPEIERRYHAAGTREGRALAGYSMGGYGALRLAFKYPQMFASVAVHSASLEEDRTTNTNSTGKVFRAFGDPFDAQYWKQNSPMAVARAAKGFGDLQIYFDCGAQDSFGLATGAAALHELLQAKEIPHEFHLYPGSHNWDYVEEHFGESMAFNSRALGAKPLANESGPKL